jgi:hypothetical protein
VPVEQAEEVSTAGGCGRGWRCSSCGEREGARIAARNARARPAEGGRVSERDDETMDPAPSLADCLVRAGVPRHSIEQARRGCHSWLHTWQGLGMTAEDLRERT